MRQSTGIINSFFWKAGERIMVQGLGLLIQIILARLLMPKDFACLAIIIAIVNYLGLFVQSGLSVAVVQKKELTKIDVSTLTSISLIVAIIMYWGLFFLAPYISDLYNVGNLIWPIRVMGVSLFLLAFNTIQTGLLQRNMMFRTMFFRSLLAIPLSGMIGISMAYMGFGIWALIAYNISNNLFVLLFMNMIPELRLKLGFSKRSAKEIYSFSLKLLGSNLISAGGDTVRTLTIGKFSNPNQLAYFDRGLNYSGLVTQVINTSLSSVLLPVLSRSQDDKEQLLAISRKSVSLSSFIMMPVLVLVAMLSRPLVLIVLSEKWLPCAIFLSIFCLLRIPGIITSIDRQAYYALGKSQIGLYYEIILLAFNLMSLILTVRYSVLAVAIGFTIIEYIGNGVLMLISSNVFDYTIGKRVMDIYKPTINVVVMALVMYILTFVFRNNYALLVSQLLIGGFTYILLAYVSKDNNLLFIKQKIANYKII